MPVCAVSTCRNSSSLVKDTDIIFHSFPRNDKRALEWFIKCKRRDKKRPDSVDRICSTHFQPDAYERDIGHELLGKPPNRKLKVTATPTLSLPYIFVKPSEARKVLTPTLARQLNKRVPQSVGNNYKSQARRGSNSGGGSGSGENGDQRSADATPPIEEVSPPEETIILKSEAHCQHLLGEVFNDETFMDITLVVQEKSIRAHKVILRQASGYFKKTMKEDSVPLNNSNECRISFDNITYEDLTKAIAFIYHGEVSIKASDLDRFLKVSEFLEIPDLKRPDVSGESPDTKEHIGTTEGKKIRKGYAFRTKSKSGSKDKDLRNTKSFQSFSSPIEKKKIVKLLAELREGFLSLLLFIY